MLFNQIDDDFKPMFFDFDVMISKDDNPISIQEKNNALYYAIEDISLLKTIKGKLSKFDQKDKSLGSFEKGVSYLIAYSSLLDTLIFDFFVQIVASVAGEYYISREGKECSISDSEHLEDKLKLMNIDECNECIRLILFSLGLEGKIICDKSLKNEISEYLNNSYHTSLILDIDQEK
ncbi:hypothetical protein HK407_01g02510 [Ordospora pajunii]|uniref:uncharacterized protein n=1 Tax=Ordospora pajunii TaxID=3039483 RepID=UPI00295272E5|nr:uncharacterized protein HK407_01g02510 [Ordospora pajunii]KAH9412356.1 hypothetical protein HK407_01g02510 [Ordospora pajunii]